MRRVLFIALVAGLLVAACASQVTCDVREDTLEGGPALSVVYPNNMRLIVRDSAGSKVAPDEPIFQDDADSTEFFIPIAPGEYNLEVRRGGATVGTHTVTVLDDGSAPVVFFECR
jgi:hypothetical protein